MSLFYHPIRLTEEAQRDAYEVRLVVRAESEAVPSRCWRLRHRSRS